jgi:hypothetical protein
MVPVFGLRTAIAFDGRPAFGQNPSIVPSARLQRINELRRVEARR